MLFKILAPALTMTVTSLAADITSIPFQDAAGKSVLLNNYKGKVILIVNVASHCGNTKQYSALEELYKKYQSKGLVILAFPANDFNGQEPGSIEEIQKFCTTEYHVTFPIMNKVSVIGEQKHPLYGGLTGAGAAFPGDVKWNFGKFLVDRTGKVIARFEPRVLPESEEIVAAIEKALAG